MTKIVQNGGPHAISNNDQANFKYNFQQRILNLKAILNIWKQRKLSLKSQIKGFNNLPLSPISYPSSIVNTPKQAISEINNLIQQFV